MSALKTYSGPVHADWTDYNGHLRDAYYLLIFSFASDGLMEHLGLSTDARSRAGHSLFTLEVHLNYLQEVHAERDVEVRTQLLAHDAKRLHIYHGLYPVGEDTLLAASEQMLLHVDLAGPKAAPFTAEVAQRVAALAEAQAPLPAPEYVGRRIGLPERRG